MEVVRAFQRPSRRAIAANCKRKTIPEPPLRPAFDLCYGAVIIIERQRAPSLRYGRARWLTLL